MSSELKNKKTLKDIEIPPMNCGLLALSKLTNMKDVSAFTLVHLARDNGQNIHVFKVADNKDLVRVIRPAIFHQKDHFVYVGTDEPMPEGEYTGFVLGANILGRVISLSEAKFIKGSKNFFTGKNKDGEQTGHGAIGDILTVVAAIVTAPLGPVASVGSAAAVHTAYGAIERAQNQDVLGSPYDPKSLAIDAVTGAVEGLGAGGGASAVTAGGGLKAGAEKAVENFGRGALQSLSHPISTLANGFNSTAAGVVNLGAESVASGINPGSLSAAYNPSVAGVPAGFGATPGFGTAAGAVGSGVNAATGALSAAPSLSLPSDIGGWNPNQFVNTPGFSTSQFSLPSSIQTGASNAATGGGGLLKSATNAIGNAYSSNPIGTIASGAGALGVFGSKAPEYSGASPIENYATTSQFLGPNALTQPTNDQLSTYISTPIDDLAKTFTNNSTRVSDAINQAYDNQKTSLVHQYAQAGQNQANSSELTDKISQLEQKRSTDLSNAALEVQNAGIGQAIQVKQQALSQGMQAGQFNQTLAMQLAGLTGDQQNLQYAIANNDYQSFQQIMGKLLTMGIPQNVNVTSGAGLIK